MKKLLMVGIMAISLTGCLTGPQITKEMAMVQPISDESGCKFIKVVYFEVSQPAWMHSYAAKNTITAGGNSYKILNNTHERVFGINILGTNIAIYECPVKGGIR